MRRVAVALCLVLWARGAFAHGSTPQAVAYDGEQSLFSDVDLDTGWVPASSPIQVRFVLQIGSGWSATATGQGDLAWPEPLSLRLLGDPDGGLLHMSVGIQLSARLRLHLDLPAGGTLDWEGDVPFVPQFDYRLAGDTVFTPFLLPGATPASAVVADQIAPTVLFRVDLADLVGVSIPGVGGGYELLVGGDLAGTLTGVRFDVEDAVGGLLGTIEHDPGAVVIPVPEQGHRDAWPRWRANLNAQATLTLAPAVYVEFAGHSWDLSLVTIPIPLVDADLPWDFGAQQTRFPLPDIRVPETEIDFGALTAGVPGTHNLRVDNRGELDLVVTPTAAGTGFGVTPATLTVGPGATGYLAVSVTAPDGPTTGTLRLESNDPDQPVVTVALTATGQGDVEQIPGDGGVPAIPPEEAQPAGGCGCRAAGTRPAALPALALVALAARRRRRRPRGGSDPASRA